MPYRYHYVNTTNTPQPGSRSSAQVYPGAVCPVSCSFGRTHGPSPAVGELEFKGTVVIPPAMEVQLNIGSSVFFGIAVKVETNNNLSSGNNSKIRLVDYRDRLLDVNIFAQYNMVDNTGTWWHILPDDWQLQRKQFIFDLQNIGDFTETQERPDLTANLASGLPMFSMYTLLYILGDRYNFTFSAQGEVQDKMMRFYPENLDWNSGKRVGEAIDEMLAKANMQFTAWGNLHLHVTEKGVPESQVERDLLAGNVNVCDIGNYREASIGQELSDKPRRVRVIGGKNKYECYYPCYPDWNPKWTFGMVFNDWELSSFLQKHDLNRLSKYAELPKEWKDRENDRSRQEVTRKWNGKSRDLMTIGEYLEQIPYKAYRVDFLNPLFLHNGVFQDGKFIFDTPDQSENFLLVDTDDHGRPTSTARLQEDPSNPGEYTNGIFYYDEWLKDIPGWHNPINQYDDGMFNDVQYYDSRYPISSTLATDSQQQFIANTTTRAMHQYGMRTPDLFMRGNFAFVTEGASLDVREYPFSKSREPWANGSTFTFPNEPEYYGSYAGQTVNNEHDFWSALTPELMDRSLYAVTVVFSERRYDGEAKEKVIPWTVGINDAATQLAQPPETTYQFYPAQVYVRLAVEAELYTFAIGESTNAPRVRELVKPLNDVYESRVFGTVVPMLCENLLETGVVNRISANAVASQVAARALNHEYLSTAGHISFRTQAGFMCSGVIESVRVQFSASTGVQETVNFTNIRNDDRVNSYFAPDSRNSATKNTEQELNRRAMQAEATRLTKLMNTKNPPGTSTVKNSNTHMTSIAKMGREFNDKNQVMMKVDKGTAGYPTIKDGELVILSASPFKQALSVYNWEEEEES